VLDPVTVKILGNETEVRRDEIRSERLAAGGRTPVLRQVPEDWRESGEADARFGETLRVRNGKIVCARCGEKIAALGSNPKKGAVEIRQDLKMASPWIAKRWNGASPDFIFIEYVCSGCGYLIDAAQRRKAEDEPWDDYRIESTDGALDR
jgi:DNA-directed RNA polymerase subunit RPC12/RpoP